MCVEFEVFRPISLCLIKEYDPNSCAQYPEFVEETDGAFRRLKPNDFTILLGDSNAHVGNDAEVWRCVIGHNGNTYLNDNGRPLLKLLRQRAVHH